MTYKPIELKDTTEMMNSDDYKKRFQAEYIQAIIRYKKLEYMLRRWDDGTLNFQPTCPKAIYNFQIRAMADYIACLETRAAIEHIELCTIN